MKGRGDHPHPSGSRERGSRRGAAAQARHSRRDLLPVEEPVLRDGGLAVEAAQGAAEREGPSEEASCGEGAEHRRAQGDQLKKLVKPVEKRRAIDHLRESRGMSLRLSCGLVGMSRSS